MRKTTTKLLIATTLLLNAINTNAQSVADAKQMYDYGRYLSAEKSAMPIAATNAEANYYLGLSQLGLEKIADAQSTFAKYPTDAANLCGSARLLFAQNKPADAMAILNGVISKAKKKDWQSYKYAADAINYSPNTNVMKAIEWYTKSLEINNANGETYMNLGDAYVKVPDGTGAGNAETNYLLALDYKANPGQVAFRRGNLWLATQEYDSAIVMYKRCSEVDAKNPLPYLNFATSYYKTNRFELAKTNLEKYINLTDNTPEVNFQYVNVLYLCKDYKATVSRIEELNKQGMDKPYLHRLSAISNYELGNYPNALKDMDNFFTKADKAKILPVDYQYYSKILSKTPGREAEAVTNMQKAIDIDTASDKSALYRSMAEDYKDKKDYSNAASWYSKLVEKSDASKLNTNDYYYYGFCNYANKNYVDASKAFGLMTEKFPDEPSGFYYLAGSNAYKDGGAKSGTSLDAYKKYIDLIGVNPDKKDNLVKAYSYIVEYYYNKNDATNATLYSNKLLAVDATNKLSNDVIKFFKDGGVVKPQAEEKVNTTVKDKTPKPVVKKK